MNRLTPEERHAVLAVLTSASTPWDVLLRLRGDLARADALWFTLAQVEHQAHRADLAEAALARTGRQDRRELGERVWRYLMLQRSWPDLSPHRRTKAFVAKWREWSGELAEKHRSIPPERTRSEWRETVQVRLTRERKSAETGNVRGLRDKRPAA